MPRKKAKINRTARWMTAVSEKTAKRIQAVGADVQMNFLNRHADSMNAERIGLDKDKK